MSVADGVIALTIVQEAFSLRLIWMGNATSIIG